jgi:acetyl esterase/lipase
LDAELAAAVPMLPQLDLADIPNARRTMSAAMANLPVPDETGVTVQDVTIPGPGNIPGNASGVPVRVYRPDEPAAPVAVLDVHGGGFVLGDVAGNHAPNVSIARRVGAVVVSVEYRLAPEHPFPAGLDDCYAALCWLADHAADFGVDPTRIALHGASAGAGLCAALALLARDRGGPPIAFQYLGVPQLDDRLSTSSMTEFVDTPMWSRSAAEQSWDAYLGRGLRGTADVSPYAAPARATDLRGLPPTYVSAQAYDPLRDEDIAYATALLHAGVPTELHLFPGTFHGSTLITTAQLSRRETNERTAVLRRGLGLADR